MLACRRHEAFNRSLGGVFFVAAILFASADARAAPLDFLIGMPVDARSILIVGMLLGIITFTIMVALVFLHATRRARRAEARARSTASEYDRKADFLKAVLAAEPQFLVHWKETGEPAIVADTLSADLGIPRDIAKVLRFGSWLERGCALELESHVADLRSEGQSFNLMLKSATGSHIEADGRAAGGSCILKFRDLAGRRRELAEICEQHRTLGTELAAMRALFDALPMPVWFHGENDSLKWVNRAYTRAVEASGAQQVYNEQIAFLPANERDIARRAINAGETFKGRLKLAVGGNQTEFDTIVLPTGRTSAGIAIGALHREAKADGAYVPDFSAHTGILDRIAGGIAVFSADQRLTYCNTAFADLWGLDADWLASGPLEGEILDKLREEHRLQEQANYREWKQERLDIYTDGKPREDWWHLPDGRAIHVVAERGAEGITTYLYENMTETLALKSQYNALMHVQKETLDHLGEGVAVFGSDGRLKLFNPSFAAIWNLDARALEEKPHIDEVATRCRALFDDDLAWSEVKAAVTGIDDQRERIEGSLERLDGMFLSYAGLPLPDGATLLTYVDISDTKRMENALIERNEALVAADRLKSAFISHISYELRTPLTNIIGFSEILQNSQIGPLNEKQQEYLADISSSSHTLHAIIADILDMATIDAGELELKVAPVTAKEIVDAAIHGVRERLTRANLKLDTQIDASVDRFMADSKRLTQVLYNLLSNAIGFSEPGGRIGISCRRVGDAVEFVVADEGCGIPEDYQKTVFDRFESKPQGSHHRGAGLGLAIVKSLVKLHGGGVELTSAPNQGTTVRVRIPAGGPLQARQAAPEAAE